MAKPTLRYTSKARSDLTEILTYLSTNSPQAATAFLARLDALEKLLGDFPAAAPEIAHPLLPPGYRRAVLTGTPLVVIYSLHKNWVTIERVLHTARRWPKEEG